MKDKLTEISESWKRGGYSENQPAERAVGYLLAEVKRLREVMGMMWRQGTHKVILDQSVIFGKGYDFFGLESLRQELHTDHGSWLIWPNDGKWSSYGDRDGGLMFEKFASEQAAKEWVLSDFAAALSAMGEP